MSDVMTQAIELATLVLIVPSERFWGIVGLVALALFVYAYTKRKSK